MNGIVKPYKLVFMRDLYTSYFLSPAIPFLALKLQYLKQSGSFSQWEKNIFTSNLKRIPSKTSGGEKSLKEIHT